MNTNIEDISILNDNLSSDINAMITNLKANPNSKIHIKATLLSCSDLIEASNDLIDSLHNLIQDLIDKENTL